MNWSRSQAALDTRAPRTCHPIVSGLSNLQPPGLYKAALAATDQFYASLYEYADLFTGTYIQPSHLVVLQAPQGVSPSG